MGQQEMYDYLKKNKNRWYNSEELAKFFNVSVQNIYVVLNKLSKKEENIEEKEFFSIGIGKTSKHFRFRCVEAELNTLTELQNLKSNPTFADYNTQLILLMMIDSKLRRLLKEKGDEE